MQSWNRACQRGARVPGCAKKDWYRGGEVGWKAHTFYKVHRGLGGGPGRVGRGELGNVGKYCGNRGKSTPPDFTVERGS